MTTSRHDHFLDTSDDRPATRAAPWLLGSAAIGGLVGVVAELLVGEESGGGASGATEQLVNVAIAALVGAIVLGVLAWRPQAVKPVAWVLVGLTVLSLLLAWYAPMALVLGSTALGVGGGPGAAPPRPARLPALIGGGIAALWLLAFLGIVVAELL